ERGRNRPVAAETLAIGLARGAQHRELDHRKVREANIFYADRCEAAKQAVRRLVKQGCSGGQGEGRFVSAHSLLKEGQSAENRDGERGGPTLVALNGKPVDDRRGGLKER